MLEQFVLEPLGKRTCFSNGRVFIDLDRDVRVKLVADPACLRIKHAQHARDMTG